MSWPGLLIRVLAVAWFIAASELSRAGLNQLGIEPTFLARLTWVMALVVPVWAFALVASKRVDRTSSEKWKIWG